jgi:hypothetical protein
MKRKIKEIELLERYLKTENEMLRTQSHKVHGENEKLKKENEKLKRETIVLTNQAYKWYQKAKARKQKYRKIKIQSIAQKEKIKEMTRPGIEILLQAAQEAGDA